jgi:hypothetical protein
MGKEVTAVVAAVVLFALAGWAVHWGWFGVWPFGG